jgi:hypothetical protein
MFYEFKRTAMSYRLKRCFLLLTCIFVGSLYSKVLLTGDSSAATGKSFSFNVSQHFLDTTANTFYVARNDATVGAGTSDEIRKYTIAGVLKGTTSFVPLTPAQVILGGIKDSTNPLIGEQISVLGFYKKGPLAVRTDAPQNLYWIPSGSRANDVEVIKIDDVKDAQGASGVDGSTTAEIIKLASNKNYAFAAVKKNAGDFGEAGAGIAMIAHAGTGLSQMAAVTGDTGTKALGLDPTTASLKITTDLASIDTSIVDMHWDDLLHRLYICVKATGAGNAADGARGVLMAYVEGVSSGGVTADKLKFAAFSPSGAFAGTTYIVGGLGAAVVADIQKVRTMHTSSQTSYLITLGNAASANATTTVSALPLVNKKPSVVVTDVSWITDTDHGALASKTINAGTNLKEYFSTAGEISVFRGRGFQTAASIEADLTAQTDAPAQVGGAVAPGTVLDMQVFKDTVFIAVDGSADEVRVYSSQALLDADGAIKAWTPWRPESRPATGANKIFSIGYQNTIGRMYSTQGSSTTTIDTVKTSVWTNGSEDGLLGGTTTDSSVGFVSQLGGKFLSENGGIQGLVSFPAETTAFSQTAGQRSSMMIATGYKKIVLVATGQDNTSNDFVPNVGNFFHTANLTFTAGAIDSARNSNTKMITVSGGALDTVGGISTATIINETTNGGYIVVGGVGGVAILRATAGGAGWATGDLKKTFNGIGTNKSFAIIGNYSNVRKVIADGQFLYILTNATFDRVPAAQLTGAITPTVLATPADLGLQSFESFSDVLVSSKLALLATSSGVYRVGNVKNISTATSATNVSWTKIALSEGPTPVTRLVPVSTTTLDTDFAQQTGGGMVYVLASSVTQELSSVYRLSTRDISGSAIADTTVEQLSDDVLSTVVGPYAHLGNYKNYFTNDGALATDSRSKYDDTTPAVFEALPFQHIAGTVLATKRLTSISLYENQTEIGKLVSNSALGSKILPTNNGLLVLE